MKATPPDRLQQISLLTKAGLMMSVGLFGLLVAWTNVMAYGINYQFVQHVLSMDALAKWAQVDALTERALTDPKLHQLAYAGIIAAEFAVGLLCSVGGFLLLIATFSRKPMHICRGKAFALAGCGMGIAVWYLGFAVIGAEYFAMWASDWNGQTTAYAFSAMFLLSMIYVAQPEARAQSPADKDMPAPPHTMVQKQS
jgi:Predicted small integral membrane protein